VVESWGMIAFDWSLSTPGKKGDYLGLFSDGSGIGPEDYDASLLTKGLQKGSRTFIAPLEEGVYHVKYIRNVDVLASVTFRVITKEKSKQLNDFAKASPASEAEAGPQSPVPVAKREVSQSPSSVLRVADQIKGDSIRLPAIDKKNSSTLNTSADAAVNRSRPRTL